MKQFIKLWKSIAILAAAFYSGFAAAHGKVTLEADACMRDMSGSMIHLSAYQPQHDPDAEYCSEIPKQGETYWVIDLVDQALRDMPIVVKIVRGSGKAISETVASFYSTNHADGVIKGQFDLDEGQYTLFVTGEGVPPLHYEYPLRIQMTNYTELFFKAMPYIITFMLIAFLTDHFLKYRQLKN